MKLVIQRVSRASVSVGEEKVAEIGPGMLVLVGIESEDNEEDVKWLSNKIVNLRIYDDEDEVPNQSIIDIDGDIILVSQFTLHARTKKGNRPSYIDAARPEISLPLFEQFVKQVESDLGKKVQTGRFGNQMKVDLLNEGPVTIIIDSKNKH